MPIYRIYRGKMVAVAEFETADRVFQKEGGASAATLSLTAREKNISHIF